MLPHHFQAADAHLLESIATTNSWITPFGFGLHAVEIDRDAISDFAVRIPRLQARLRDGTLISVPENAHLSSLDVRPDFENAAEIYIHLALPEVVSGEPNTQTAGNEGHHRYILTTSNWDELNEGHQPSEIDTLRLNAQLIASAHRQSPKGYDTIVIARLRRSAQSEAPPELDTSYIPPLLNCETWPFLQQEILDSIRARLGSYIKTQAEYLRVHGGWAEANQPQIRRAIKQLDAANTAHPVLAQLSQTRGVHPQVAYFELCRLLGSLAVLRDDWQVPDLPPYDHEDLGRIFLELKRHIDATLTSEGISSKLNRRPFVEMGDWMEVDLEPQWLRADYGLYIGVRCELPPEKVEQLFSSRWLDWKLGSSRTIVTVYANAEAGLQLKRVVGVHPTLPALQNQTYFEINCKGPYWNQVQESRSLALKVNERYISNKAVGQRVLTVVDPKNTPRDLTIEIFVVEND